MSSVVSHSALLQAACVAVGGKSAMARHLGVAQSRLSNWLARSSVPEAYCAEIERLSSGLVRRWDFFPASWHRVWPELVGAPGAPCVRSIGVAQEVPHA
ncbi:YdaS family helix-turn-helix protein [Comamonadaceae bacterium PP-2]